MNEEEIFDELERLREKLKTLSGYKNNKRRQRVKKRIGQLNLDLMILRDNNIGIPRIPKGAQTSKNYGRTFWEADEKGKIFRDTLGTAWNTRKTEIPIEYVRRKYD